MFNTILVPLDGSRLAESALPIAVQLAQGYSSRLILFHGIESNPPIQIHGERHLQRPEEADQYLKAVTASLAEPAGRHAVSVSYHIHEETVRDIRQGIAEHIEELHPDLIVMSSHGKRGLKKAVLGSIPLQILNKGNIPLLLVQSEESKKGLVFNRPIQHILLPLDSASRHDASLKTAVNMANALNVDLTLMTVIPTVSTQKAFHRYFSLQLPISSRVSLEIETAEVARHLKEHFQEIQTEGSTQVAVHTLVARGDVVTQIQKATASLEQCLLVLGTHGKIGMEAFWADSVAFRIAARIKTPVLFIPL